MRKLIWYTTIWAVAFSTALLFGQSLGGIVGEVKDATGAVIAGATVTVTNSGTNAARSMASNDAGLYSFPALVPGQYTVRVETRGFKPVARSLEIQVQQTARVDFS